MPISKAKSLDQLNDNRANNIFYKLILSTIKELVLVHLHKALCCSKILLLKVHNYIIYYKIG